MRHPARRPAHLLIAALSAALAGACGAEGGSGDVRQEQRVPACAEICDNLAAAGCDASSDPAACLADCEPREEIARSSEWEACTDAWADWTRCAANEEFVCEGFDVSILPCREERDRARNRCELGLGPEDPCLDNPVFDHLCPDDKPDARICRGVKEEGCVVGGTDNHADLYCCP